MAVALGPRVHSLISAADLVALGLATHTALSGPEDNPDPVPAYGELRCHTFGHRANCDPLFRLEIPDAVVHGPEGVVTVGRYALMESVTWTDPVRSDALLQDGIWMSLNAFVGRRLARAEHLLCGYSTNYHHWLADGIGRLAVSRTDTDLLVPAYAGDLRRSALQDCGQAVVAVGPGQSVAVDRLFWTSNMTSFAGAYHPALRHLADRLLPALTADAPDRIYVSRRDSQRRRLVNEEAVEDFCRSRGFVVLTPSRSSVAEQARSFRSARWIIAPHGASLVNLLFCRPGASLLELLMDNYLNWSSRQLAGCMGVRYGCVIGRAGPGDPRWVHGTAWTIDMDRLALAVDDPAFGARAA